MTRPLENQASIINMSKLNDLESEGSGETNAFKNKQKLVQFLQENKASSNHSLEIFKWSGLILLVILGFLAILSYVQSQSFFDSISTQYSVIAKVMTGGGHSVVDRSSPQSNLRQSDVQRVIFKVQNYELMRLNLLATIADLSIDKTDLGATLTEL